MSYNNIVLDKGLAIANGSGPAFKSKGGRHVMSAGGTFGGGNIGLEWTQDAVSWFAIGPQNAVPTLLSAAGSVAFDLAPGQYRVTVAGATTPSLAYWIGEANQGG